MIFCAHTQEEEGLIEKHERLFEAKTYSPVEDTYVRQTRTRRQVKTRIPGEDT